MKNKTTSSYFNTQAREQQPFERPKLSRELLLQYAQAKFYTPSVDLKPEHSKSFFTRQPIPATPHADRYNYHNRPIIFLKKR